MTLKRVSVAGFKSIHRKQSVRIAPLTVLAGANSSGKSSLLQTLLLLKQTLDAPHDPGPLLLYGTNVKITSWDQIRPRVAATKRKLNIEMEFDDGWTLGLFFDKHENEIRLERQTVTLAGQDGTVRANLREKSQSDTIQRTLEQLHLELPSSLRDDVERYRVVADRCFLNCEAQISTEHRRSKDQKLRRLRYGVLAPLPTHRARSALSDLIHVPGLRGNPERSYKFSGGGSSFPGTFDRYVASVLSQFSKEQVAELDANLTALCLTNSLRFTRRDDVNIEIEVNLGLKASERKRNQQYVNIADVGFGVSQVLPILVALLIAEAHQIVYIEQPEIHLHPRAQVALSGPLVAAAKRGVRVVVETHSSLLLTALQTAIADGEIPPESASFNWFARSGPHLSTDVIEAQIDEIGRLGDWPQDFDEVAIDADMDLLAKSARE